MNENAISKMSSEPALEVRRRATVEAWYSSRVQLAAEVNASPSLCLFAPLVPVGTALSGRPPDRTRRADFPHRAPTLGQRRAKRVPGQG